MRTKWYYLTLFLMCSCSAQTPGVYSTPNPSQATLNRVQPSQSSGTWKQNALVGLNVLGIIAQGVGKGLNQSAHTSSSNIGTNSQTVYSESECIGPVIMGVCRGTIVPHGGYHKTCYGTMLNGECTGPLF